MTDLVHQWGLWLDTAGWATAIGLIASIISIAGVPFAALKAWQARRSADAARRVAEATATRIRTMDAVRRLASSLARLDELHERLGVDDHRSLSRPFREQRRELIYLVESGSLSKLEDRAILRDMTTTLLDIETQLDVESPLVDLEAPALLRARLNERMDELHRVLARLERRASGDHDNE